MQVCTHSGESWPAEPQFAMRNFAVSSEEEIPGGVLLGTLFLGLA